MVKKLQKLSASKKTSGDTPALAGTIKDSAQQIWLAGLGAFAKAQEEGNKMFDALVRQGQSLQRKSQEVAHEQFSEAASRVSSVAQEMGQRASGQWDKLEAVFETRVTKALKKLGVPSSSEVEALIQRVDALNASVQKLSGTAAKPASKKAAAPRKVAGKAAAKSATSAKTSR